MADLRISNLCPTGTNLLMDSESYMEELSEQELVAYGGVAPMLIAGIALYGPSLLAASIAAIRMY